MTDDDDLLGELGDALSAPVPPIDPSRTADVVARARAAGSGPSGDAPAGRIGPAGPGDAAAAAGPSRRRLLWMGAAAAGGVAAGITGAALVIGDDDAPAPPTEGVAALTTAPGVEAEARLIAHTWGLEVLLDVTGLAPGTAYAMTFVGPTEAVTDAGGFLGAEGLMKCRNNGSVLRPEVSRFEVTDPAGTVVVRGDLA